MKHIDFHLTAQKYFKTDFEKDAGMGKHLEVFDEDPYSTKLLKGILENSNIILEGE